MPDIDDFYRIAREFSNRVTPAYNILFNRNETPDSLYAILMQMLDELLSDEQIESVSRCGIYISRDSCDCDDCNPSTDHSIESILSSANHCSSYVSEDNKGEDDESVGDEDEEVFIIGLEYSRVVLSEDDEVVAEDVSHVMGDILELCGNGLTLDEAASVVEYGIRRTTNGQS